MQYSVTNKVNVREFITNNQLIRERLPRVIAKIENSIDELNELTGNNLTIVDFIENIPQSNILKVVLLFAQNDEESIKRFLEYKNHFSKGEK